MPAGRWTLVVACLAWGGPVVSLRAAPGGVSVGAPYTIDVKRTEDGLPGSSVIAMTQTRDGYLWLGTLYGLARFDGLQFTVFDESNTPGLSSSRIVHLFEDSHTNLWIGTDTGGVVLVQDGEATSMPIGQAGAERRLTGACEDSLGAVWLCTKNGELWRYAEGQLAPVLLGLNGLSGWRTLIAESPGPLWVGTDRAQYAINPVTAKASLEFPMVDELPAGRLDFLLASAGGGYWRLADGRIQKWTGNRLERDWGPYPWGRTNVTAACEDRQGNLVVGTLGAGVFWFDADGKATRLSTQEGLSYNYILSLVVDREGNLWVGTDGGGLNRVRRQVFQTLTETRGLVVQSVMEDTPAALWLGFNVVGFNANGVSSWTNGVMHWFGPSQGLMNSSVRAVFLDRDHRLWAGTWGAGLFRMVNGQFQRVAGAETVPPTVHAIHEDRAGQLWIGTQGGLARWDEQTWTVFTTTDGLTANEVQALADDPEGNLWVGTVGGGLSRLRDGRFTPFRKSDPDGLPSDNISSLWVDPEGVLWIGTAGGGLARLRNGRWTRYSTRDGLLSNSVGYLLEDGQGFLWMGSNAGLMRVPKKALNDFADGLTNAIPCRAYAKADGLPTSECTYGSQPAACRTRDGRLWFPTIEGLVSVDPARLSPNRQPPPVIIESVLIDGQLQNTNRLRTWWPQPVVVPAGKERLEIRYTSLNLGAPERARFKYRLEGHETDWTDAGNDRIARYPRLPPGRYRFQVKACNEDGRWNEDGRSLTVMVEPPFWRTWWFLAISALAMLALIVGGVHYFSTQKLHRQLEGMRQQEALEKERARIARDLHDQLGASLTQVSLLGELAQSDKDVPAEVEGHARQITQTARDTTRALDEIVWTVNPSNDTLDGLVNYACKYAQDYLGVAGLRYRLDVPAQLPTAPLAPEVRHNVFLAFKEAVTNVVRHAQASAVGVRLRVEPDRFTLEIQDDGRGPAGMNEERAQTRNGLRNMRKRLEDLGGAFAIGPAPGGGTLVRLTAPWRNS
jgi:ligand-binding sensor domain-containing protein